MEKWMDVINYKGIYQVSDLGNMRSLDRIRKGNHGCVIPVKGNVMKQHIGSNGYYMVRLTKHAKGKTRTVHSIMAESFLKHKRNGFKGLVVNHIDRNKLNNTIGNLELVSNRENTSFRRGKSNYLGVTLDRGYIYSRIKIDGKTVHLGSFKTELEAHEAYKNKLKEIA